MLRGEGGQWVSSEVGKSQRESRGSGACTDRTGDPCVTRKASMRVTMITAGCKRQLAHAFNSWRVASPAEPAANMLGVPMGQLTVQNNKTQTHQTLLTGRRCRGCAWRPCLRPAGGRRAAPQTVRAHSRSGRGARGCGGLGRGGRGEQEAAGSGLQSCMVCARKCERTCRTRRDTTCLSSQTPRKPRSPQSTGCGTALHTLTAHGLNGGGTRERPQVRVRNPGELRKKGLGAWGGFGGCEHICRMCLGRRSKEAEAEAPGRLPGGHHGVASGRRAACSTLPSVPSSTQ